MSNRVFTASFAACLFLLIVGAKWATFERFGSPMPDWDQWDAEGSELFIPWFEGDRFLAHLFHPHNEHRVVLTKLQNLALGLLNGQWDSRLEAVTNAMLHAALGAGFWWCACGWIARGPGVSPVINGRSPRPKTGWQPVLLAAALFVVTAALFALPVAWQNVLGGFHSQQYWLLAVSFIAIAVLPFARSWSPAWWLGALGALLALGSMGSGLLTAAVVLGVVAWRLMRRETTLPQVWPTLAVAASLLLVGLLTRVEFPGHQDLKAKTAHDFIFSIVHSLQWPLRDRDWAALVLWAPWLVLAWRVARADRGADTRVPQTILALGGWVLLQVFATAYARGVGADYPASRYMDTLAFGALANAAALAWLLQGPKEQETKRPTDIASAAVGPFVPWSLGLLVLLAAGWLATLASGLHETIVRNVGTEMPDAKKYYIKAEGNMRRYLGTNDRKHLPYPDIPFPDVDLLIERLGKPSLRALMPLPIRAPLPLKPAEGAAAFVENDARGTDPENPPRTGLSPRTAPLDYTLTWGSFNAAGKAAGETGTWRSAPVQPTLRGWLKFETAGQARDPNGGVGLELRDARTDAVLARVRPDRVPGDSWRAAYVRTPRAPFVVVAEDRHEARWLAFSGPTEMGALSYWAWRATRRGFFLLYAAAGATVVLAAIALRARVRRGHASAAGRVENRSATRATRAQPA